MLTFLHYLFSYGGKDSVNITTWFLRVIWLTIPLRVIYLSPVLSFRAYSLNLLSLQMPTKNLIYLIFFADRALLSIFTFKPIPLAPHPSTFFSIVYLRVSGDVKNSDVSQDIESSHFGILKDIKDDDIFSLRNNCRFSLQMIVSVLPCYSRSYFLNSAWTPSGISFPASLWFVWGSTTKNCIRTALATGYLRGSARKRRLFRLQKKKLSREILSWQKLNMSSWQHFNIFFIVFSFIWSVGDS